MILYPYINCGGTTLQGGDLLVSVVILGEHFYGLHHHGLPPIDAPSISDVHCYRTSAFTAVELMVIAQIARKIPC